MIWSFVQIGRNSRPWSACRDATARDTRQLARDALGLAAQAYEPKGLFQGRRLRSRRADHFRIGDNASASAVSHGDPILAGACPRRYHPDEPQVGARTTL